MKTKHKLLILAALILLTALACNITSPAEPTPTPIPTATIPPPPTPTPTPDPAALLAPGWEALEAEDFETAARVAQEVLDLDEETGEAWLLLGQTKLLQEDYLGAIPDLETAYDLGAEESAAALEEAYGERITEIFLKLFTLWDPNEITALLSEGDILYDYLKDLAPESQYTRNYQFIFDSRVDDGADVSNIPPDALDHFTTAEDLFEAGEYEAAIPEYQAALEIVPDFFLAHLFLGDTYYYLGDFQTAVEYMEMALVYNPFVPAAWAYLGDAYKNLKLPSHAREAYLRALFLEPDNGLALEGLDQINNEIGDWHFDTFDQYGFRLMTRPGMELIVQSNGLTQEFSGYIARGQGIIFSISHQEMPPDFDFGYDNLLQQSRLFLEAADEFEAGTYEVLTDEAFSFPYGTTTIAVQPYLYSAAGDTFQYFAAEAHADCDPQRYILRVEFYTDNRDSFYNLLPKILESFRCDTEPHFWFYNN